jgi:hypothetical protein
LPLILFLFNVVSDEFDESSKDLLPIKKRLFGQKGNFSDVHKSRNYDEQKVSFLLNFVYFPNEGLDVIQIKSELYPKGSDRTSLAM